MNKINNISASDIPPKLTKIPRPPERLWYIGELADQSRPVVAIVGTRKPTAYGRAVTSEISGKLSERGVVIVSGLAHGIDGIAHQACLDARGTTMAVVSGGIENPYPASHRQLAHDIVKNGGALISEDEPGTPILKYRFLERNRLVIGLADALVITEASLKSGTMNTAMHALAQNKDIYVVPGNITSPMSAGCNALLAQGAQPIVDIDLFVDSIVPRDKAARKHMAFTPEEYVIITLLEQGETDGDILQAKSGLSPEVYLQTITMLEITGTVKPLGANMWNL